MKILNLFEQSGNFKNAFIKAGHSSIDVDLSNQFNQTDIITDLFAWLEGANKCDELTNYFKSCDIVIAFFPCTWFSNNNDLIERKTYGMRNWSDEKHKAYILERHKCYERAKKCVLTLVKLCNKYNKPLIIENPHSHRIHAILGDNYIYHRRSDYGDMYHKPTDYYCYNGATITELDRIKYPGELLKVNNIGKNRKIVRSLMSNEYVDNFTRHIYINGTNIIYGGD